MYLDIFNKMLDSELEEKRKLLETSPYSTELGMLMAADARKVMNGRMEQNDFYEKYAAPIKREFGGEWAALEEKPEKNKKKGPRWGMVIDLAKCVGCDTCTVSCKAENRTPPGVSYNVVIEQEHGTFPNVKKLNLPRPCMQCDKPPCAQVCPVRATYKMDNGIVAIDAERCIGCRYCVVACPYGARSYDNGFTYEQEMLGWEDTQAPEFGNDRGPRVKGKVPEGTVRKCTFCFHRLERGEEPACVETCIGDARYFGDLDDPNSIVSKLAASPRAFRLREELGTEPRVFYLL